MQDRTRRIWQEQDRHEGDRLRLFTAVTATFPVETALYPGSFADVAPSFVVDDVTYVDSDRRAAQFFSDAQGVDEIIAAHRPSGQPAAWRFLAADYRQELPVPDDGVDLLVSLYAGPVSDHCTRYLRPGGLLLANASHGDASLAGLDPRFDLVAAVRAAAGSYRVTTDRLERFLRPTRPDEATPDAVRARGRGLAYTTPAFAYVFRRREGTPARPDAGW